MEKFIETVKADSGKYAGLGKVAVFILNVYSVKDIHVYAYLNSNGDIMVATEFKPYVKFFSELDVDRYSIHDIHIDSDNNTATMEYYYNGDSDKKKTPLSVLLDMVSESKP